MTDQTITTEMVNMYQKLGISSEVLLYCEDVLNTLKNRFEEFEQKAEYNQLKVIRAMQDEQVNATHFSSSSGYGYDDAGRETLEKV